MHQLKKEKNINYNLDEIQDKSLIGPTQLDWFVAL